MFLSSRASVYPIRNNATCSAVYPSKRGTVQGSALGLDFGIIPAGFNTTLEFLTGFARTNGQS